LLILHSNAEVRADQHIRRKWSWENLLAGLTLLAFIGISFASHLGIWASWILLSPLLFPIVFFIYRRRDRQQKEKEKNHPSEDIALTPFSSMTEILRLRRKTLFFKKQSYPYEIGMRKTHGKLEELSMKISAILLLPVLPLALLLQCIPVREGEETHILVLPE
jgi:Ca2+/Na+ antiporter